MDSGTGPSDKKLILMVDDDEFWLEAVTGMVKDMGYELHTAYDGMQGLSLAEELQPDVLVADYYLPKMDGLTLCSSARRIKKKGKILTVILSCAVDQDLIKSAGSKVDALIAKASLDLVLVSLREVLEGKTSRGEGEEIYVALHDQSRDHPNKVQYQAQNGDGKNVKRDGHDKRGPTIVLQRLKRRDI